LLGENLSIPAQLEGCSLLNHEKVKETLLESLWFCALGEGSGDGTARRGDGIIDQAKREKSPKTMVGLLLSTATSMEAVAPEPSLSNLKIPLLVS
jgi:hypothetical protein